MPVKVILVHKISYMVYFENFHSNFHGQFLLKKLKKMKISKLTKYDFLWSQMTLSGIISTKTSKSPGKSSENRTAFDEN